MTFIYELDPFFLEIHRMCIYELPAWRLSKAIIWQTYREFDQNYKPLCFAGGHESYNHLKIAFTVLWWGNAMILLVWHGPNKKSYSHYCDRFSFRDLRVNWPNPHWAWKNGSVKQSMHAYSGYLYLSSTCQQVAMLGCRRLILQEKTSQNVRRKMTLKVCLYVVLGKTEWTYFPYLSVIVSWLVVVLDMCL